MKRSVLLALGLAAACAHGGASPDPAREDVAAAAATAPGEPESISGFAAPDPAPEDPAPSAPAPSAEAPRPPEATPPPAPAEPPPAAAPPARKEPRIDLAATRAGAEAVLRAESELYWRWFTRGEAASPATAWKGHEALLSDATLRGVAAAAEAAKGNERRALSYLHAWLVGERLSRDAAHGAATRPAPTFEWGGRAVPLREAAVLLAGEHDRDRRKALATAAATAARSLAPAVADREARLQDAARALGYPSTLDLAAEVRGEVPDALAALAEAVLARTEDTWTALLSDLARREGLEPGEVRVRDLPRLLRTMVPAAAFPGDRQLEAGAALLAGIGVDLARQRNLHLDSAARAGKLPGAIALPVDPPADVRLSTAPLAGLDPLRAVLHELGIAEAYAHVRAGGAPELRRLGPAALPEAWGILVEEVAGDSDWLQDRGVDAERARVEARTAAARRLLRAREAAARVLAAIARARAPAGAPAEQEAKLLARARGCPADAEPFPPAEPDPLLRSAETLRAELLAAQAELFLGERALGKPWWRSDASGSWLVGTWAEGSRRTVEETSLAMGQKGIDPAALEAVVKRRAGL